MNSREKTEKKVFSYIEEHRMIAPHDKIVVGVSGGADSVCLLFLLLEYAKKVPVSLAVVHVNHGIRPDAGEDARFVEELCRQKQIPFFLTQADVKKLARQEKCSQEDAGRRVRYEAFRQAAEQLGGAKTAVAHNSNDNAETMLFHLFRGSGLKGLCGIAPVRDAQNGSRNDIADMRIIRPILCLERQEIEEYLKGRQIDWRTDSTNSQDDYRRNRIRHHILPYAEQEIVTGAVEHMNQTADMLRETDEFLEQQTLEALDRCLMQDGHRYEIDCEAFQNVHPVLQKRMLLKLAKQLSPTGKDISLVHIQDVLTLFAQKANRSISLPFGIIARRQYDRVVLEHGTDAKKQGVQIEVPLTEEIFNVPLVYDLGNFGKMEITAFFAEKEQEVTRNQYTKWFDYDKIEEWLVVRSRCTGDYFTISDGAGSIIRKSLKDYMVTEKIPRHLRDQIPVVAVGNHVLWLVGWRISEYFKVSGNTNRILQVKLVSRDCVCNETEEKNGRAD